MLIKVFGPNNNVIEIYVYDKFSQEKALGQQLPNADV